MIKHLILSVFLISTTNNAYGQQSVPLSEGEILSFVETYVPFSLTLHKEGIVTYATYSSQATRSVIVQIANENDKKAEKQLHRLLKKILDWGVYNAKLDKEVGGVSRRCMGALALQKLAETNTTLRGKAEAAVALCRSNIKTVKTTIARHGDNWNNTLPEFTEALGFMPPTYPPDLVKSKVLDYQ